MDQQVKKIIADSAAEAQAATAAVLAALQQGSLDVLRLVRGAVVTLTEKKMQLWGCMGANEWLGRSR
jgi:hypothetical protein